MSGDGLFQVLPGGVELDEQVRFVIAGREEGDVGAQRFVFAGDGSGESGRQSRAFGEDCIGHFQHICQDEAQPLGMDGGIGSRSGLVIGPFVICHTQEATAFRVVGVEALGEDAQQDGHAEERAGYLDE